MPASLQTQPSLLDWKPQPVTAAFAPDEVRGASIAARISRGVAVSLKATGKTRHAIAQQMSRFLGLDVSKPMIDGYAAPSRDDHAISVVRFIALLHVTQDRRLLQLVADELGWAVIEKRFLPLIEVAEIREREDALKRRRNVLLASVGRR